MLDILWFEVLSRLRDLKTIGKYQQCYPDIPKVPKLSPGESKSQENIEEYQQCYPDIPKVRKWSPGVSKSEPMDTKRERTRAQRARKGSQGDLKGSLAPFWHPFGNTFSIFVAFRGFSLNCDSKRKVFWILGPPTMFFASDFAEHPHMTVGTSLWLCFIIGQYFKP